MFFKFMYVSIYLLFYISLLMGIFLCIKHSFRAGVYFFAMFLFIPIYEPIASFLIEQYIVGVIETGSVSMWIAIIQGLIPKVMEISAIVILIIGLYRLIKK